MIAAASIIRPPQYNAILAASHRLGFEMNADVLTGALLRTRAAAKPNGRFLELGTGCGLGTCWIAAGMNHGSSLVSVDNDPRVQAVAQQVLEGDQRISFVLRDGGEYLEMADAAFDLIYADAWPGKYSHLDQALRLLAPGGVYVIDDMLPQPNWPDDHPPKVESLLKRLHALDGFAVSFLSWSTGVVLATRR
jgi:predicted O-methyltransferase YrrM